jgi:hypothetical protein
MRYDNVLFEFVSAGNEPEDSRGSVLVDGERMVLEVECEGDDPYLIQGRSRGGFYSGHHVGQLDDVPVEARWASIGDTFVGQWVEDGDEYLFRFALPTHNG